VTAEVRGSAYAQTAWTTPTDVEAVASRVIARRVRLALLIAAALLGLAFRLWYLLHQPVTADEAIAGLMATQILHGHFTALYWGQVYGGSAEEVLLVPVVSLFGPSGLTLHGFQIVLSMGSALLTWRIARRLVDNAWLAAFAGVVMWIAPQSAISNFTYDYAFRSLTMLCGLGTILISLRALDGSFGGVQSVLLGLVAGIGWWSSPEIVYFLFPAAVVFGLALYRQRSCLNATLWARRSLLALAGFVVGAFPWLWANVHSHLASLRPGSFGVPPGAPGYLGRLGIFPRYVLPMLFSLRQQYTGSWLGGHLVGRGLFLILIGALTASLVACIRRGGGAAAIGLGAIAFPFLLAISPATWFWRDGRYVVFAVPLLVLVLAVGADVLVAKGMSTPSWHRRRWPVDTASAFLVIGGIVSVLSLANFFEFVAPHPASGWSNPDAPSLATVHALESAGITNGYANYWVAYRVDFLSDNRLHITVTGSDPLRWRSLDTAVRKSDNPAWLFVKVDSASLRQFGATANIQGPGGMPLHQFLSNLQAKQIAFRTVQAGMIEAVIPSSHIAPADVGLTTSTS
jgi:hypothetical protein